MKNLLAKKKKSQISVFSVLLFVGLALYVILLFLPLIWMAITSFKGYWDYRLNKLGLPSPWTLENYKTIFEQLVTPVQRESGLVNVGIFEMYGYSLLYAIGCAFFATFTPCITAYCCVRFPCKFSSILNTIVIVCMSLPIVGNLPSEIKVAMSVGTYGHIWGMWVMKTSFLGLYFLVFFGTFGSVSKTYTEAAQIDGAGNVTIFFRIMLPLVRNVFFTVMLIKFIEFWNDYQTPLIYMEKYPTIAVGVYRITAGFLPALNYDYYKMAAAMIVLLPSLILFVIFQKKFMGDLTVGGVKG